MKNPLNFLRRPDPMPGSWPADVQAPAAAGAPNVYRNPFPPQAGRRVEDRVGQVWQIDPTGDAVLMTNPAGTGVDADSAPMVLTWGQLLATNGPVTLLPLTAEESASETLYGPVGARWGKLGTPCAYEGCTLDLGHVGTHYDKNGEPLGVSTRADRMYVDPPRGTMLRRVCTCGNIAQHQPGCNRYVAPAEGDGITRTGECGSTDGDGSVCVLPVDHEGPHEDGLPGLVHPVHQLPDGSAFVGSEAEAEAEAEAARMQFAEDMKATLAPTPRKRAPRKVATTPPATGGRKRAPRKGAES